MSGGAFLLVFLLVCMVAQIVFCCGACAGKESSAQALKMNTTKGRNSMSRESNKPPDQDSIAPLLNTNKEKISATNNTDNWMTNISSQSEEKQSLSMKLSTAPTVKVDTTKTRMTTAYAQTTVSSFVMSKVTQSLLGQNFTTSPPKRQTDFCTAWEQCSIHRHPKIQAWLSSLPACPCRYPYGLYYNNTLYDKIQRKLFSWRNVNSKLEKLAIFKPTAAYCIRQLLSNSASTTATQQCCYDHRLRLITRGSGSGTPNLVAPELDEVLHNYVDLLPFISCQGDWTRYQAVRPPNNALKCRENPKREEFRRQLKSAREF